MHQNNWITRMHRTSIIIFLIIIFAAIFAPIIAPLDPNRINLNAIVCPPLWTDEVGKIYLLGTDNLGRDVLSQLLFGARASLFTGITVVTIAIIIGTCVGLVSGYYGGILDDILMRLADIQQSFPSLLLIITLLAFVDPGLFTLIIVLIIESWITYARVARGQTIITKEKPFIEAARAIGIRDSSIILRHILPNISSPLIIIATYDIARIIITEASLSFIGLGVSSTTPTWGALLANGREFIFDGWWMIVFPTMCLTITVLSISVLGGWMSSRHFQRSGRTLQGENTLYRRPVHRKHTLEPSDI